MIMWQTYNLNSTQTVQLRINLIRIDIGVVVFCAEMTNQFIALASQNVSAYPFLIYKAHIVRYQNNI